MKIKHFILMLLLLTLTVSPVIAGNLQDSWENQKDEGKKNRAEEKGVTRDEEMRKHRAEVLERFNKSQADMWEKEAQDTRSITNSIKKLLEHKEDAAKSRAERKKEERERKKKNFEKDRRLAEQGDADAQVRIGREYGSYYSGLVAKDYKEAFKWYKLSAAKGNAEAQYELGGIYQQGYGDLPDISGQLIKPHSFSRTHLD